MDLREKVVLLTGGTGSFGRKFTKVLLQKAPPRKLIIFSRDEMKQEEMRREFDSPCLRFFIGDVRERDRLYRAMRGVDVVVHAAALKQVPACEYNPFEAVKTNIIGAANVIDTAIDCGVERAIALSSDKAVNPVNLYGATKLCAEKLFVQGNAYSGAHGARFSCARYGNVVASRGSVIPLFLEQRSNGTVTVTDRRMTRFWITLDQGVEFVLRCLEIMRGGEIFVPKIPSMNIMDLVHAIAPECQIEFTGIRPGERLHELLISRDEARHTIELSEMFIIEPVHPWWQPTGWSDGKRLADDFAYSSDLNPEKIGTESLLQAVGQL
ncbi:MAG: UDP-N-acetylglucosamine 4,6-dehydratase (inverting) [Betaproteobacteria bacterium RIFCSPLOWO2_12_FULL_65_14]|nr:MAG: UDP-N-acetylglucosamine 4,6-dehydratase (inverting) [Betaproteobacteria bacterium RIFCSPLOWO2_12_FULL_65_14]